jgi:hypothetical protein
MKTASGRVAHPGAPAPRRGIQEEQIMTNSESQAPQPPKPDPALEATFRGRWSEDGTTFSGGWRPNPGREGPGNPPYGISGHRAQSDG